MPNHFSDVAQTIQNVPQSQRPQKLVQSIADGLLGSGEQKIQQCGTELEQVMPQILKAFQQS